MQIGENRVDKYTLIIILVINLQMAFSSTKTTIYMVCIGTVCMLVIMHIASRSISMQLPSKDTITSWMSYRWRPRPIQPRRLVTRLMRLVSSWVWLLLDSPS
jgi:hypothetical protein